MTDLDPAGQRANEAGWSPAAIKAEKDRAKALKRAAAAARWSARIDGARRFLVETWDFLLRNLLLWVVIAGTIAAGLWEWWNSARGWRELYPGAGVWAFIGAAGAIGLWFVSVRMAREYFRASKPRDGFVWVSVAVAMYLVCVAGVLTAVASNSVRAQRVAKESRDSYTRLVIQRDELRAKVELNDPAIYALQLEADQKTLKALVDTAIGTHGMPDLDPGSGCPAPPRKFFMERLCAQANGGIDPFNGDVLEGKRLEIKRDELALANSEREAARLEELNQQVRNFTIKQGDETAEALGDMFSIEGGTVMGWLLFVLSSLFLYGSGWSADWSLERIENLRLAGRAKRKVPPAASGGKA